MIIKPIVTFKNGTMTDRFVFGGTKKENLGHNEYTYQITSYLIDLGHEVILIDTSFPDYISELPTEHSLGINIGKRIDTFESALNKVGYACSDIDKIVLTHNNLDHAGAVDLFPNAEIIVSETDVARLKGLRGMKLTPVSFDDDMYKNFRGKYEVASNVYLIPSYGHSLGHCIVIAYDHNDGLHYMFEGDASVSNDALIENEILLVFEDLDLAIASLDEIRTFIKNNPTVYLSTHDPKSVYDLEEKRVMEIF